MPSHLRLESDTAQPLPLPIAQSVSHLRLEDDARQRDAEVQLAHDALEEDLRSSSSKQGAQQEQRVATRLYLKPVSVSCVPGTR